MEKYISFLDFNHHFTILSYILLSLVLKECHKFTKLKGLVSSGLG